MGRTGDICREKSLLNSMETRLVDDRSSLLPLISDMSQGRATLYARAKDPNYFVIIGEEFPRTSYVKDPIRRLGIVVDAKEEPLIEMAFQSNQILKGKRQWSITDQELDLMAWPISLNDDQPEVILTLDWAIPDSDRTRQAIVLETSLELFKGTLRADNQIFRGLDNQESFLILDDEGKIIWANQAAEQLYRPLGISQLIGRWYYDRALSLKSFARAKQSLHGIEIEERSENRVWRNRFIPVVSGGILKKMIVLIADKTEVWQKEKEIQSQATIIQEIHHRVKNNLQTVSSLLSMQMRRSNSDETKSALQDSIQRISSMALVHDILSYQQDEQVELKEIVERLLQITRQIALLDPNESPWRIQGIPLYLGSREATTLGLILNEFVQNALSHGKVNGKGLQIKWDKVEDEIHLCVSNQGNPLSTEFSLEKDSHLGLKIVQTLVQQDLQGRFQIRSVGDETLAEIWFERGE